jgi:hypothetical protein
MMFRRSSVACLGLAAVLMLVGLGCSDDPTGSDTIIGDPNSAQFQGMRDAIATMVDSTLSEFFTFAEEPYRFPVDTFNIRADLGIHNPNDSILYNYTNGWHVLYLGLTSLADYAEVLVDSARFFDGEYLQTYPTTATDGIDLIHHQASEYDGQSDSYQNFRLYVDVNFPSYRQPVEEIEGIGEVSIENHTAASTDTYDFSITVNSLVYQRGDNTPWNEIEAVSGNLNVTATVVEGDATSNWTVTVTFTQSGVAQIEAVQGNTEYDYNLTPFGN